MPKGLTTIFEDNLGAIRISENPTFHSRRKHIDVRVKLIESKIEDGTIKVEYCTSKNMAADILTKPLAKEKFKADRMSLSLQTLEGLEGVLGNT